MLPTRRQIERLHRKYAPSPAVYGLVMDHCRIVHDICVQLAGTARCRPGRPALDMALIEAGSLLHDIGAYPLFAADGNLKPAAAYIRHGTEGEAILRAEGLPPAVCRFASHHTGVGLSRQDIIAQQLPLPPADYLAGSHEELLVMYADKFHSKTTPPYFNSFAWYRQEVAGFGEAKARAFDAMAKTFGKPDLAPLSRRYGFQIR